MSKKFAYIFLGFCLFVVLLAACNSPAVSPRETVMPTMASEEQGTSAASTHAAVTSIASVQVPTAVPAASAVAISSATPLAITPTTGPTCTVQQALNLRSGPGTAYRPPIQNLDPQTVLVPLGFNAKGIPAGTWVQVKDESQNQIGWVSAGTQFISCNIDVTSLPSVAVAPPPPPPPPSLSNSTPDGNFPDTFVWKTLFSSQYFVRMKIYDSTSGGTKDGSGIKEVSFNVQDSNGNTVYQRTEKNAGFCIFGGGEPDCNPWVIENYTYKWKAGGKPVQSGDYTLQIQVTADNGDQGNWNYSVSLNFPK